MSDILDRLSKLSPKQLLLLALDQQEELDAAKARAHAPIAIVGMGCRFPGGADNPALYWALLREGRDAVRDVPGDRWDNDAYFDPDPDVPGRISTRQGGFLDSVDGFDAGLFGIAAREAQVMDPQQRLLLEVAWEALENAGIAPERLSGSSTGVFVGLCNSDHFQRALRRGEDAIDAYLASGNAPSVAAGRISYCLGLHGPALTIDTACSSSLVAIQLACQSLRAGETSVALACGVNVMCTPEIAMALTKAHMLSPDGRSKSFDAAADGFGRGEGCGVLVLKRLDDAIEDQDNVVAVIQGIASNQDGRSGGLTVPSGAQQEAVIRSALADAGLKPDAISYVEAHGTGTTLGDPIEIRALATTLGNGRSADDPLIVGSVKANFGHLESAAGIAGVMKVALALQNERIPPQPHFKTPSPHIPWANYAVRVEAQGREWARGARPRLAGISSFGFSGTNAHAVIGEAPAAGPPAESAAATLPTFHAVPVSARSANALGRIAASYADAIDDAPGFALSELARTAGVGRSHFAERACIIADDAETLRAAFLALAAGKPHAALRTGSILPGERPEAVFSFPGELAVSPNAVRTLYERHEVFRDAIDRCDGWLKAQAGDAEPALGAVLRGEATGEGGWSTAALFGLHYALTALWRSFGIEPVAVVGYGVGEYAAACAAGVVSAEDGLRLSVERGRLAKADAGLAAAAAGGGSAFGAAPGSAAAAMEAFARGITMQPPLVPVYWTPVGGNAPSSGDAPEARYWGAQVGAPGGYGERLAQLYGEGHHILLEMGPQAARPPRDAGDSEPLALRSLAGDRPDQFEIARSLAELYVRGAPVDWKAVEGPGRRMALPTYPFEHVRYWLDGEAPAPSRTPAAAGVPTGDDLLGMRLATAAPIFEALLTPQSPAYLAEHRVQGQVRVAGSTFLDMVQRGAAAFGSGGRAIDGFSVEEPLVLPPEGRTVQLQFGEGIDGTPFSIHSRDVEGRGEWRLHARGRVVESGGAGGRSGVAIAEQLRAFGPAESCEAHYERLSALGIDLGAPFRFLKTRHGGDGEVLVKVEDTAGAVRPGLIDAALQVIGLAVPRSDGTESMFLLTEVEHIELAGDLPAAFWCHARIRKTDQPKPVQLLADVTLRLDDGTWLGELSGIILRRSSGRSRGGVVDDLFYEVGWEALPAPERAAPALLPPSGFIDGARAEFGTLAARHGLDIYNRLLPELDRLSADHIGAALRALGFDATPGRTFGADAEGGTLGVIPRHARLFHRLMEVLADAGVLAREGGSYRIVAALPAADPAERYDALIAEFTPVLGELNTLRRCGFHLAEVLTGRQDPLQLLFPGGSLAEARTLYVEAPSAKTYNSTLAEALRAALRDVPADRPLRVLEIGAGTGGTTGYVLPVLKDRAAEYSFTDVSPMFLEQAQEIFAAYPFLKTALLDIERNPVEQGFEAGAYDVVIAANVLHATADMGQTMHHVRTLLADGGLALLLEGVTAEPWVDLTFGLTEGWWRFVDASLRPDYPLIDAAAWDGLLKAQGFADIKAIPAAPPTVRAGAQQALLFARADTAFRSWTVVGDRDGVGKALADLLAARGYRVALKDAASPEPVTEGEVVYLGALELSGRGRQDADAAERCGSLAFAHPRGWLAALSAPGGAARGWFVTRGTEAVDGAPLPGARWQAPLWGLGRVFALERPDRWGGLIDLPPEGTAQDLAALILKAIEAGDGEDQVAYRGGMRKVARLRRTEAPEAAAVKLRSDGTYLITGGFGGLGLLVARWLAENGAGRIALVGRQPDPELPALGDIRALGAVVTCHAGDVADEASMRAVLAEIDAEGPPLRGILHAAAAFSGAAVTDLTPEQIEAMMRPKVAGTLVLEKLAAEHPVELFVLFSTTTALIGAAGLAHYAGASLFLDATAKTASRPGLPLSINWGTWDEMRLASAENRKFYRESGLQPMPGRDALDAMGRILAAPVPQSVVARVQWDVLKPVHEARRRRPFLSAIEIAPAAAPSSRRDEAAAPRKGLADSLAELPAASRHEYLLGFVQRAVAETLGSNPDEPVPVHLGLFELGMDSLMSVELKRKLEQGAGRSLPSTLTFNYPNIGALAAYLGKTLIVTEKVAPVTASAGPAAATPAAVATPAAEPVAERADLEAMSTEDLQARLLARLRQFDA